MEFELSTDIKNEKRNLNNLRLFAWTERSDFMINGCKLFLSADGESSLALGSARQRGVVNSARGWGRGGLARVRPL